jgi:hypothetical protein
MSTETLPVTQTLEELDFTPECEVDVLNIRNGVLVSRSPKCSNKAAWSGAAPCGHDSYFCEQHHIDCFHGYTCNICKRKDMMLATYRWVRL